MPIDFYIKIYQYFILSYTSILAFYQVSWIKNQNYAFIDNDLAFIFIISFVNINYLFYPTK